jgi:hypothetical protein
MVWRGRARERQEGGASPSPTEERVRLRDVSLRAGNKSLFRRGMKAELFFVRGIEEPDFVGKVLKFRGD